MISDKGTGYFLGFIGLYDSFVWPVAKHGQEFSNYFLALSDFIFKSNFINKRIHAYPY